MIGRLGNDQVLGLWGLLFAFALVGRWVARKAADRCAETERCLVVGDLRGSGAIGDKLEAGGPINAAVVAHLPLDAGRGPPARRCTGWSRRSAATTPTA